MRGVDFPRFLSQKVDEKDEKLRYPVNFDVNKPR